MVWIRSYLDVGDPGPAGGRRDDEQREGAGKGEERVDADVLKDQPPVVVVLCDTIGMRLEGGVTGVRGRDLTENMLKSPLKQMSASPEDIVLPKLMDRFMQLCE